MSAPDTTAARLPWDAADPYPFYEAQRSLGPVAWDATASAWIVVGYDAAREVLGGTGWTSDPLANPLARQMFDPVAREFTSASMLFADGPDHIRLRGSVRDVFTRTFIAQLGTGVEQIAAAVVNRPAVGEAFDFMSAIALPLPIAVIGEWLHLEPETAELLRELSPAIIRTLGTLTDAEEIAAGSAASATLLTEFLPLAADRRQHPAEDLLSFVAADPALTLEEVAMTAILVAVAGHETTANFLGTALIRLLTPQSGVRLADSIAAANPALLTELLRLDGPVQATVRTATDDHRLGDAEIRVGDSVVVAVAAANRDPDVFEQPDRLRLDRSGPAPLSFGYGAHYCVGAALAQLEARVALTKILARQPIISGAVVWRDTLAIRGPLSVPMLFRDAQDL
jgi:cytochrome P450